MRLWYRRPTPSLATPGGNVISEGHKDPSGVKGQEEKTLFTCDLLRRICHILHFVLVVLHLCLVGVTVNHLDRRIIILINPETDVFTTILSASLQTFYTSYTALLVYLTQRVSIWRSLSQWQRVTFIHDLSEAWTGLGAALVGLWNQLTIAASPLGALSVAAYLLCITILHITSSSIMQFQNFNNSITASVPTTLGWPDATDAYLANMSWATITAVGPFVDQLSGIESAGASNGTVYDVLSSNTGTGYTTVNATRVKARCSLLTGVTYSFNNDMFYVPSNGGLVDENWQMIPWKDQIISLETQIENVVAFIVTTGIEASPETLEEAVIPMYWPYYSNATTFGPDAHIMLAPLNAYLVSCNITTVHTSVAVDVQTNGILLPDNVSDTSSSPRPRQWTTIPANSSFDFSLPDTGNYGWVANAFSSAGLIGSDYMVCTGNGSMSCYELSNSDLSIMQLVGANSSQATPTPSYHPANSSDTTPTLILSVHQMETAVASLLAKSMWTAGLLGSAGGGFDRGTGSAPVTEVELQMRLNINWVPVSH
ncbi:hypothetical protein BV22DRAFT_1041424 [Leucogyrophana mollusca]|uniref:Uncharacterized protein n=1 Tax=Leucogyrophana mollusca TaxID=85980 RepID=A0ACB8B0G8_9AGAM|nr:hypothetical protein BV22DRAFT_1041424 [Leucogyrophana mollusca]